MTHQAPSEFRPLPNGWTGEELRNDPSWIMHWSEAELDGLDKALAVCTQRRPDWQEIGKGDFPLTPALAEKVEAIAYALEEGPGLVKIEGLPLERFGQDKIKHLWFGLAQHVGRPRFQDSGGQLMREIKNEGGNLGQRHGSLLKQDGGGEFLSSKARTYSAGELRYHTDRCDVVGLLCLGRSKSGGLSKIASTIAVHNAILERRPDLLELLYQPYRRSRLGEEQGGEAATYDLPVFGVRDGKLTSHYSRTYIEAVELMPGAEKFTPQQWEALDLLAAVAEELSYAMFLNKGDIQFINSHVTYHARTDFEDAPEEGMVRQLLRVWLAMPNSRALPEDHRVLWGEIGAGALRGGIAQDRAA